MKRTLYIVIKICVMLLLFSLWGFYNAIRPFKITSDITPKQYGMNYENVSFVTQDNILIRGWFIKNRNPHAKTIILLHGYPADKGDILPATIFLHEAYNLLYFDFRYLGESEGFYSTIGKNEILDLQAAIQYLHTRKIDTVGVWGFSMGGAVALMTAPLAPQIKAIVAESSYARLDWMADEYYRIPLLRYVLSDLTRFWGWLILQFDIKDVSPANAVEKLTIPVLLIHSKQDKVIPFKNALLLEKMLHNDTHLQVLFDDNARHGQYVVNRDEVIRRFFAAAM